MDEVYIGSCPTGIDWEVKHEKGIVILKTEKGATAKIDFNYYKTQVLNFVDEVK